MRGYLLVDRLRPFGSVEEALCEAAFFVPLPPVLCALTDFAGFLAVFVVVEEVFAFTEAVSCIRVDAGFAIGLGLAAGVPLAASAFGLSAVANLGAASGRGRLQSGCRLR